MPGSSSQHSIKITSSAWQLNRILCLNTSTRAAEGEKIMVTQSLYNYNTVDEG